MSLAVFVFASCNKNGEKGNPDDTSSKKTPLESRADAPMIAEKPMSDVSDANTRNPIDPPISHPVDASMIRPAGTAPEDASWDSLTAEQKLEKFSTSGIARMPKDVSDKLIGNATAAELR